MSTLLPTLAAAALLASLPAWALSEVTLHNLSDQDLIVTRAQGPGAAPMGVNTECPLSDHRWCPDEPRPFGRRVGLDNPFAMDPGRPPYEYWLKARDSVTFLFDEAGGDRRAEVYIQTVAWHGARNYHGLLVYLPSQPFTPNPQE